MSNRMQAVREISTKNLAQEAVITVVFAYMLLVGGTLNGLALYGSVNISLALLGLVGGA